MTQTQLKSMRNIIAENYARPMLQGKWIGINGCTYCVCGYYGVMLHDVVPEINSVKGDQRLETVFDIPTECDLLTTPKLSDLKAHVKGMRKNSLKSYRRDEYCWDFGKEKPWVNPWYLMDILTILPDATLYYLPEKKYLSPIYFKSEKGNGILLPIVKS